MGYDTKNTDTGVLTRKKTNTKEPPLYKVILLNDDYTTMEFVILILEKIFRKNRTEAEKITLSVHKRGSGVAGIYPKEIAETKATVVHRLAAENQFPLRCTIEPN